MKQSQDTYDHEQELIIAVMRLESKMKANDKYQEQVKFLIDSKSINKETLEQKEQYAKRMIDIARVGFEAGYISEEEYVFYMSFYIEGMIHEERWTEGYYQNELGPIQEKIRKIEKKHGLKKDEYWPAGKGPKEYRELNKMYDKVLDDYRLKVFREFNENELANLIETDLERYNSLREIGRKSMLQLTSPLEHLYVLIETYKHESQLTAEVHAYYAACGTLGAALEAILLALCYQYPKEAEQARQQLSKEDMPKKTDPDTWTLVQLVNIGAIANWLPIYKTDTIELNTTGWVNLIRSLRNLLHPGNHLRNKPRVRIGQRDYEDAQAVYVLVENQYRLLKQKLNQSSKT